MVSSWCRVSSTGGSQRNRCRRLRPRITRPQRSAYLLEASSHLGPAWLVGPEVRPRRARGAADRCYGATRVPVAGPEAPAEASHGARRCADRCGRRLAGRSSTPGSTCTSCSQGRSRRTHRFVPASVPAFAGRHPMAKFIFGRTARFGARATAETPTAHRKQKEAPVWGAWSSLQRPGWRWRVWVGTGWGHGGPIG